MANQKNNFFSELSEPKTIYQEFLAELGIERVKVLIPIKKSKSFLEEVNNAAPNFIKELKIIVEKYDGIVERDI